VTSACIEWRELTFRAHDGLELFARECGSPDASVTPLFCLAGLTRNSLDFEPLAEKLAEPRRIIALDYRGRGRSQYAPDYSSYTPRHELADSIALLDRLALSRVCVIGTSRGGIIAMLMAALHPDRIAGALLNDIGPQLTKEGLLRIATLLSTQRSFGSWSEAAASLRVTNPGISGLSDADWEAFARRIFREDSGRLIANFDPRLAETFPNIEDIKAGRVTELWESFEKLKEKPCAVLRGQNSDLLSHATMQRMAKIHSRLMCVTVENRGHVPFLDEPESLAAIRAVAWACDHS
jgi:pimeloyl-ACP methyl ester carboxylesterase